MKSGHPRARAAPSHRIASRLIRYRTPSARLYAGYRDSADLCTEAHRDRGPILRLPDGREVPAQLRFRPSILFGRDYLVAWVDDGEAFRKAMPEMDAVMSPISEPWMPFSLPLIVAPKKRRRSRVYSFLSVFEHEVVHVNQAILGLTIPELRGASATELLERFFTYAHLEHEAHFIQSVHWPPPRLKFGTVTLSRDQWVLLRAYTPAIEGILRGTAHGHIPKGAIVQFLDYVPKHAPARLRQMGCRRELVTWFQSRWAVDVSVAVRVLHSQGLDPRCTPFQAVYAWLRRRLTH